MLKILSLVAVFGVNFSGFSMEQRFDPSCGTIRVQVKPEASHLENADNLLGLLTNDDYFKASFCGQDLKYFDPLNFTHSLCCNTDFVRVECFLTQKNHNAPIVFEGEVTEVTLIHADQKLDLSKQSLKSRVDLLEGWEVVGYRFSPKFHCGSSGAFYFQDVIKMGLVLEHPHEDLLRELRFKITEPEKFVL